MLKVWGREEPRDEVGRWGGGGCGGVPGQMIGRGGSGIEEGEVGVPIE